MLVKQEAEKTMSVREESGVPRGTIPLNQHFVLVHGINGGSWCWYKIRSLLENSGFKVSCIDLKSAGIDPSDVDSVLSFDDYNQPLMDFFSALPENEQVILVGHSAGGLSLTLASHKFAKKILLAVYVAATMLKYGFCTDEDLKHGVPDISEFGDVNQLRVGQDKPPTSILMKKELQREIIYHLCPHEDSTLAAMLLRPGPIQALKSARFIEDGEDEVEKVPRVYIRTRQDKVMKPEQQEAMIKRWPPLNVYELDTDHSPFFSTPFLLVGLLVKAAAFDVQTRPPF
ncbi:hypothetical protein VNO78_31169 [Psophocarpus tetragonolobus]|uniref:AB hydrolase-1 domain-containing protein n=1 Tax=Psophocarpus tetragonolobus TaxID=3891 RepID=A0AAN9RY04_PSOTE